MITSKQKEKFAKEYITSHKEFICGWGAAMINISVTFPVNKVIFRQMLYGINVQTAFMQIANEGFISFYRGILPPLMQKSISSSLMFGTYDIFRKPLINNGVSSLVSSATAAILAGSVEAILTPFERIQTLLQDSAHQNSYRNMMHVVHDIWLKYGMKEYYRGLSPILLRNGPSNVVFFILRDEIDQCFPNKMSSNRYLKAVKQFVVGACIGAINSTLFYPFNVIKVHMQCQLGGPYLSVFRVCGDIYRERNRSIRYFYKGVHMNYTRSFVSWGVINLSYEHLKYLFFNESISSNDK